LQPSQRKKGVDLFESHLAGAASLLAEPGQKRLNVPASVVDRVCRQAALLAQVAIEPLNQIGEWRRFRLLLLQSSQEAKPGRSGLNKPFPREPSRQDSPMPSLVTNPATGCHLDLRRQNQSLVVKRDTLGNSQELRRKTQ